MALAQYQPWLIQTQGTNVTGGKSEGGDEQLISSRPPEDGIVSPAIRRGSTGKYPDAIR
jgi:hypothetical protein